MSDDSTGARVSSQDSAPPLNPARDREQPVTENSERPLGEIARILERVSDAFLSLDARWRCTYLNSQAARLLGREANGLIGRNYWTEFPGDVGQPFYRACHRALAELIPIQIEEYFAPTDRWFETHVYPGADGLSVFFHDVTQRKKAERERDLAEQAQRQALQRAEQFLQVGAALGGALTEVQVTDVILQAALPIFEASMGLVVLLSEDGATLHTAQVIGVPSVLSDPWREFSVDAPAPLADAVREKRLVLTQPGGDFTAAYPHLEGVQVAVPLLIGDRCIGGLGLMCPPERCQDEGQRTFLWTLAGQCALALERARLYDGARREVEERQRVEEALRESEARFRGIIDSSAVAYALNDDRQNVTFLNAEFVRTFGYTLADIPTLADWWPRAYPDPEYRQWVAAEWQERLGRARREGTAFEAMELTIRCRSGGERTVLAGAASLGASLAGTHLVSLYDITERKRAEERQKRTEEALRETLTLQQAISEEAPVSIVISRMSDGTVLYANPFAHHLFGVAPDADLSRHVSAEFYQNPAERAEIVRLLALHPLVGPREMGLKLLDGTPIWAVGSFQRLTYGGEEAVLATHHDLTERNQAEAARQMAEENYRALFMDAVGGIFQTSPEGRYLQVNPALARIYGYETPEQMIGELTDVTRQLYVEAGRRAEFERLMKQQGFVSRFESQVRRRDGSVIWIAESARPIWDASGVLLRYEGFVEDVSDRKALEAQQAYALQEAIEQADRDSVTGLLNHRAFYKRLEEETARAEREGTTLAVVMLDLDNFGFFNNVYGHTAGDRVLRQVAERLQEICRPYDTLARFGGDEFALLLPRVGHTTSGEIEARLRTDLGVLSFWPEGHEAAIPITVSVGSALRSASVLDRQEVVRQADERLMRSKTGGAVEADQVRRSAQGAVAGFSMLDALVTAVDNKDRYTRKHSEDVMRYSLRIARALGLDEAALQTVAVGALLHDVGKIGIPDAVLRKPGKLTGEEFEAIKQHPQMGAIIVQAVPGLEGTLDAVRHHHERWDGGGYPLGLRGEETPLIARLMAVADAYSAMTTDRPYRKGMGRAQALAILEAGAGAQWDARCVQAFIQTEEAEDER